MLPSKHSLAIRFKPLADPGLLVVLLISTLAVWPLITRASLATGTDAQNHVYRVYEILAAWREGIPYPRWATDFYYGFGYPVFDYYSTLSYYLAAAYGWFFGAVAGVKFVLVLSTYIGIAGVYLFARDEWGPAPAIVSAALFGFAPYIVLVEPLQRGGLPEELAVALAPWLLWSFTRLARTGSRAFWFLATLTLAAIVVAHNLMSFVFIGLLGGWLALRMLFIERPASRAAFARSLALMGTAALVAAALTAFMWLPAAVERGAVQYQNAFALVQARRFLSFGMLFAPATPHDAQTVDIALYQFRLGWPQWILGALGALTLLRPRPHRRATLFWLLVTLPCIFVMDPVSNWFWQHFSVLPYLQFSYRLLAVTALSLAIVAGALVEALPALHLPLGRHGWAVLLVAMAIIGGLPLLNPAPWPEFGKVDPAAMLNLDLFKSRGVGTTGEGEFLPVTVQAEPVPIQPVVDAILAGGRDKVDRAALPAGATADETAHDTLHNTFQVTTPAAFTLRLFTFYWPGWTAYVDGVRTPIVITEPQGFISVPVPAGTHSVTVQLEDTAPRRLSWAISAAGLLALLAIAVVLFWRRPRLAPSGPPAPHLAARPAVLMAGLAVVGLFARVGLDLADHWQAAHLLPTVPQAQVQHVTRFDDGMALVAYDLPVLSAQVGGQVPLRLYWDATASQPEPASVFVHIYGPDGQLWGQGDQPDPSLFYPTTRWALGVPVVDDITAAVKPNAPPGRYTLAVGLWNRASGVRSQLLDANGQATGDVRYTLSDDFQITPEFRYTARQPMKRSKLILAGLVLVHVVLGLWFNTATPIFEAPDEDGHYLFIRYLQLYHSLPVQTLDTQGPRAHHPPLFHLIAAVLTSWVPVTGDAHRIVVQVNPKVWFRYDDPNLDNKNEYVHYGPDERWPYAGQALIVHITRVLALAFSVVGVLFTYLLARQLRPEPDGQARSVALLATALVAFNPMLLFMTGVAQNNTTMLAAGAVILYVLGVGVRRGFRLRNWVFLGVLLAAGLLLQLSSLVLAAPIGLTLLYDAWRQRKLRIVFTGGLAIALPFLALTGWWFWRNYVLYGDFTANKIVQQMWCCDPIPPLLALKLFLTGLLGRFGNGLMITYPYAIYWLAAALGLLALAGCVPLVVRAMRGRTHGWPDVLKLEWLTPEAALWVLHAATILGVFGALVVYAATVAPGLPGRYTFPAYPSMGVVLAAGWLAWFKPRWHWPAAGALIALNLAASLFALFGMLIPTYRMPLSPSAGELKAMTPLDANIGSTAQVLGVKLSTTTLHPGDTLQVTLYVQPLSRTDVPYTVFVHLTQPGTPPLTQADSYPGLGNYATTVWDVGRTFVDSYQLKLPADAPPGTLDLVYGLYNGDTGLRLPVTGANAGPADDDWVSLGTVEIKP